MTAEKSSRSRSGSSARGTVFPIVEVFGHRWDATTASATDAFDRRRCPFTNSNCEKFQQYGYGYCSVPYAAADDAQTARTYAVCDHRLDGQPLKYVVDDHFGSRRRLVVPEIVLTDPKTSFDFVACDPTNLDDIIAIETQAIDIRGGGVGPAFAAWRDGRPADWRSYFTKEATTKGRKDDVAYGVNMANIYKRLGLQVAVKGSYLKGIRVPFYVLMQHRPFQYLRKRIRFEPSSENWDVTFVTFEYTDHVLPDGSMEFAHMDTVRTTISSYVAALASDAGMAEKERSAFLARVRRKAGLP